MGDANALMSDKVP